MINAYHLAFSVGAIVATAGALKADAQNTGIRYGTWDVPTAALDWAIANAQDGQLENGFWASNVAEYDTVIVFLRDWSDGDSFPLAPKIGLSADAISRTPDTEIVLTESVKFTGFDGYTHFVFVHAGKFAGKTALCQGQFLLQLITKQDWAETNGADVDKIADCQS